MAGNSKQYGLVMPKKGNQGLLRPRPSVFDEDSDSSQEASGGDWVKKALKQESQKTTLKKQTQLEIQRAVQQDPTVYQYDEVYDKMEEKKSDEKAAKKAMDKKPRYIQSLLKQAERRKREQDRRTERLIQKEREAEGEEFKDKEAFVTSAYREKLEEFKKLEEEEKRQDYIDDLTDVSKQQDLSGFYRHLYRQTVSGEEVPGETKIKIEKTEDEAVVAGEQHSDKETQDKSEETKSNKETEKKGRQYRKRRASSPESEEEKENSQKKPADEERSPRQIETKTQKKKKKRKSDDNIDADTASSSSSDSESGNEVEKTAKVREDNVVIASGSEEGEIKEIIQADANKENIDEESSKRNSKDDEEVKKEPEAPKINIWAKRTVGTVFDEAVQRYYQRKANKLANSG